MRLRIFEGGAIMKELAEDLKLNREELCDWFGIKTKTFSTLKKQKLEELKDFCDYELIKSQGGSFKAVYIKEVYEPIYSKKINPLKKKFLAWIAEGGIAEVALQTEDRTYSYPTVVNYFCKKNDIPYEGPHHYTIVEDGVNAGGSKIEGGRRRVSNREYPEWHYLYRLLKKYQSENKIKCGLSVNCCAGDFNPTKLRLETAADRELQNQIYQKYFGKLSYEDINELVDQVTLMIERGEISSADRDFVIENKLMRNLSNKTKRQMAAEECADSGVLRRKGYTLNDAEKAV
jgi:hypothetical protein